MCCSQDVLTVRLTISHYRLCTFFQHAQKTSSSVTMASVFQQDGSVMVTTTVVMSATKLGMPVVSLSPPLLPQPPTRPPPVHTHINQPSTQTGTHSRLLATHCDSASTCNNWYGDYTQENNKSKNKPPPLPARRTIITGILHSVAYTRPKTASTF